MTTTTTTRTTTTTTRTRRRTRSNNNNDDDDNDDNNDNDDDDNDDDDNEDAARSMSCPQVQMKSPSLFPSPDPYRHHRCAKLYNYEKAKKKLNERERKGKNNGEKSNHKKRNLPAVAPVVHPPPRHPEKTGSSSVATLALPEVGQNCGRLVRTHRCWNYLST